MREVEDSVYVSLTITDTINTVLVVSDEADFQSFVDCLKSKGYQVKRFTSQGFLDWLGKAEMALGCLIYHKSDLALNDKEAFAFFQKISRMAPSMILATSQSFDKNEREKILYHALIYDQAKDDIDCLIKKIENAFATSKVLNKSFLGILNKSSYISKVIEMADKSDIVSC